jgi:hypothetical protein
MLRISIRCLQYKLKAYGRDIDDSNPPEHKLV